MASTEKKVIKGNDFGKVVDIRLTQKNHFYFYTPAKNYQKLKLKGQYHFEQHKYKKYLGINLAKDVQDLHIENYRTQPEKLRKT